MWSRRKIWWILRHVPAVEYEKAKSPSHSGCAQKREQIERDRSLEALQAAAQKMAPQNAEH